LEQSLAAQACERLTAPPEEKHALRRPDEQPLSFREFVSLVNPKYKWYRHCEVLAGVLQRVADGELKRVMVFMPPRHGKSELVSRLFTAYYLYRFPERWVGICSYSAELAYTLSRSARDNFTQSGGKTRGDASAVKHWETAAKGGLWASGVGGPITGKGFHLGVIDDPVKNAKDAQSETIRQAHKDWYGSTFLTREQPQVNGVEPAVIFVLTRWNEDDLAGWQLAEEASEDGEQERWHIVCYEAIKEEQPQQFPPTCTVEPDWREPGEALCEELRPLARLKRYAKRMGDYFFSALFQQRPRPKDGGFFKEEYFGEPVKAVPVGAQRVRYWDKAATEDGGAYSVGVLMALDDAGTYYVEDVERGQWSAKTRNEVMKKTAAADAAKYGGLVETWVEEEPGSGGKESAEISIKSLAGYVVRAEKVTGDKQTRARPLSSQAEAKNVKLVEGAWNRVFVKELCDFPYGKYKDQVDAAAGAFNKLSLRSGKVEVGDKLW
jgi:predicted phage terminase large subunit-like protein